MALDEHLGFGIVKFTLSLRVDQAAFIRTEFEFSKQLFQHGWALNEEVRQIIKQVERLDCPLEKLSLFKLFMRRIGFLGF